MAAISSRISLPISFSVFSSVAPERAICSTPLVMVILETMGFSVSVGKVLMPSTWLLMLLSTSIWSASSKSMAITEQAPSDAVD